jgi:GNAT superfamily N-acetyltransferase
MATEGRMFGAVNANVLDQRDAFERDAMPMDYEAETGERRLARRMERWSPADIVTCRRTRTDSPDADALISAYFAELAALLGGFDPSKSVSANADDLSPPHGMFILMSEADRPVACGGFKTHAPGVGEIKRMFTVPEARGRSLGRDLLLELEDGARDLGMHKLVLDTAAPLAAATILYRSAGYVEVPSFNANPYATRWFAKDLA